MRSTAPILAVLLVVSACRDDPPEPTATVRLAAVPGRPAAGYFTLPVAGDKGALLAVRSSRAGRIEMHETMQHGGISSMRPITRVPVREGETLTFSPGGRHLMIHDLDRTIPAGGQIDLILDFERGSDETLAAEVVPTGGDIGH